ncbi:mtDNA inheritance, partitioning of the mitochondrial organelle [Modicella reniformis]|uniref:MtDNA inheritance, partitioning of the mitochondrial organelle n=1 Tax=Modicella reniformis TaxID=1440133 RepID=A0A9P6SU77_9FUNG|nr:mtDNA inheritance, partitioning of the mitochondrial organelle [Modicella reniformis]
MYYSRGQHHRADAFSPTSTPPQSSELRLYTWKNATLGEITSLVKQAVPDLVTQAGVGAQLAFRHIYLDIKKGIYVGRDVGTVRLDNPQSTLQGQMPLSDEIPKEGLFTKDMHGNGSSIVTTGVTTGGGAAAVGAAAVGAGASEAPGSTGIGGGSKAHEKTLASIKFVIGDYLDIAITSNTIPGFMPSSLQRRQLTSGGGGGPIRHQGVPRSGRHGSSGGGLGVNPLGDRFAGRLGGFGYNGHGQRFNGRGGQVGLDVHNEPNWKTRGRGR